MPQRRFFGLALALAALSTLPYAPALQGGFVWDDVAHIRDNSLIESWGSVASYFDHLEGRYFRPLVFASYRLDDEIHGLSPLGFHLTNLLLHAVNVLLVALLARRTGLPSWCALAAAALFASHPLQTDAVAYISGRTDLLMTAGALLAVAAVLSDRPATIRGTVAAAASALAILSKESGIGLLIVLPYTAWNGARRLRSAVAPSVAVAIALIALRPGANLGTTVGSPSLAAAGSTLETYAELLLWPRDLHVDRLTAPPHTTSGVAAAVAVALIAAAAAIALARRGGAIGFWTTWAAAFYLPVANLVPLYPGYATQGLLTAEHNLYAPLAGLSAVTAIGFHRMARSSRIVAAAATLGLVGAWSVASWRHSADWIDERRLFASAAANGAASPRVWFNLGNTHLADGKLADAIEAYRQTLERTPADGLAWMNLAVAQQRSGQLDAALAAYRRALTALPNEARIYENLGTLLIRRGDRDGAAHAFERALALDPDLALSRRALEARR